MAEQSIQKAGSVEITELKLISNDNTVWDLTPFLVELNIYEDMFSNSLHGNMVLSDSRNLIEYVPILGEEYLTVNIKTPTFTEKIKKTFRVYRVSDRTIVRDNNTQLFTLHFASIELFNDILLPLFAPFEGKISEVVGKIFTDYIVTSRDYKISDESNTIEELEPGTPLVVLNDTANQVKFVSPGWSPFKCINWLASKAIPRDGISNNFLFFETNKAFYFGSVEHIFKDRFENQTSIGTYSISAANLGDGKIGPDINREYFIAKDVDMIQTVDHIKNYTSGYLANRLIALDVFNKEYKVYDYDYMADFPNHYHTSGPGANSKPPFSNTRLKNFASSISFYPINPKLYDDFKNNVSERIGEIYGNRVSSMHSINNIKMHATIPGRTDIEAGRMLYFSYPSLDPKSERSNTNDEDESYSGYYLITAIHHKINPLDHSMRVELVKDSLVNKNGK